MSDCNPHDDANPSRMNRSLKDFVLHAAWDQNVSKMCVCVIFVAVWIMVLKWNQIFHVWIKCCLSFSRKVQKILFNRYSAANKCLGIKIGTAQVMHLFILYTLNLQSDSTK